jgi:hypothetical protein
MLLLDRAKRRDRTSESECDFAAGNVLLRSSGFYFSRYFSAICSSGRT